MELSEILYQKTNDVLKQYARLCDGCSSATRKDDLVRCIQRTLLTPESLHGVWAQLDNLSKKAIAMAFHNDGHFDAVAFAAQYGQLPERPQTRWFWHQQPILFDLFIYEGQLPSDLMPLLEPLVPPPERFQLEGLATAPTFIMSPYGGSTSLIRADTEQAGLHDLAAYLRLVDQGQIKISATTSRATLGSIKKVKANLLDDDFLPLPENFRATDTIRPFGLDVLAQEAGLAAKARGRNELKLTPAGQAYYQTGEPEPLLEAFEAWTEAGSFDELSRISAIKGQRARGTNLTPPAGRREAVIEALSWCPVNVWLDINDFYRALKIWHFDFEVERSHFNNLYLESPEYGALHGESYWLVIKGLYVNAILWEYLGSVGALDLLYTLPDEADLDVYSQIYTDELPLSPYDGLKYFRINNLGAYLLGQADAYIPAKPPDRTLFAITADLKVTLTRPDDLTPNDQHLLEQVAVSTRKNHYRLDSQRLLTSLEEGHDLDQLADFLSSKHTGALPAEVLSWLEQIKENSRGFSVSDQALILKAQTPELAELVMADRVLQKFCYRLDKKTLAVPANKEKAFRTRLKELEYILL
ncbi:MAG TPA: hypothetical protein VGD99_06725 [Anaerolineae bacterium]